MKHFAVLLVAATGVFAADFMTGQAARAVIGQPSFTAQSNTPSQSVVGGASGLAYANGMLVVADSNRLGATPENNRVLMYSNIGQHIQDPQGQVPQGSRCPLCTAQASLVLGQPDFSKNDVNLSQSGLRQPTAVATDGTRLVVADTNNNRVLIWSSMPSANNQPADLVIGQPDFTSGGPNAGTGDVRVPSAKALRGPQGVWIQGNMLFVTDTQNHRVLIWNNFPTQNFQPADLVLGQPNFTTTLSDSQQATGNNAKPNALLNPVAASSDGIRLFVTDLGNNRVLIWNTIPTQNGASADLVIGQPDLNSGVPNNSYSITKRDPTTGAVLERQGILCTSNGKDANNVPTYPALCGATLNFPRFALPVGDRLFIADGGNDRVLIFNTIPTQPGARADIVLGQVNETTVATSDTSGNPSVFRRAAPDAVRTPCSLAWDGTNLYVSEPFSRRVLVFSPGSSTSLTPVRNAASVAVYAHSTLTLSGKPTEAEQVGVTIAGKDYKYTVKKNDTLAIISQAIADAVNANGGDPNVIAAAAPVVAQVQLTARQGGLEGNNISVAAITGTGTSVTNSPMSGGNEAAQVAAGTLVSFFGQNLAEKEASADMSGASLPTQLGGVEVYFDGVRSPLLYVGPNQINAQLPFVVSDATAVNAYARIKHADGTVTVTNAVGVPIVPANPGVFSYGGIDPRPGVVLHYSSYATGTVSVDGSVAAGNVATIKIEDRSYSYTAVANDTLATVRDALIAKINAGDPKVKAYPSAQWTRVRLQAKAAGTAGNGIKYSATSSASGLVLTVSNTALTGANVAGAPVTTQNPAAPGETIVIFATGLGTVTPDSEMAKVVSGEPYKGSALNTPAEFVSSMAGGKTASVNAAAMKPGTVGIYQVELELNTDLPTNPLTQAYIAQDVYISNIVTFPLKKP